MSFLTDDWDALKNIYTGQTSGNGAPADALANSKLQTHLGLLGAVMGGLNSAIGTYYAAKSAQYQQKSIASSYQFQSDIDAINSRAAENDAQLALEAGKTQVAQYTMRAGEEKATTANETAAHGIVGGVGSSKEIAASQEIAKDIDVMTINSNATRQAWADRTRSTALKSRALMDRVSASNATLSANSISPVASGVTSLLGSASSISNQWAWYSMMKRIPQTVAGGN